MAEGERRVRRSTARAGGERKEDWLSAAAAGEMELGSLNMDVIFRAEQKEGRRDERASEGTNAANADMGCGKNRGSG